MKRTVLTSFELERETRRRIDDLRQARARATDAAPPSMREIVTEALELYLDRELKFTA